MENKNSPPKVPPRNGIRALIHMSQSLEPTDIEPLRYLGRKLTDVLNRNKDEPELCALIRAAQSANRKSQSAIESLAAAQVLKGRLKKPDALEKEQEWKKLVQDVRRYFRKSDTSQVPEEFEKYPDDLRDVPPVNGSIQGVSQLYAGDSPSNNEEVVENSTSSGAGFGDPEQNRKVEAAAINFVTGEYVLDGYAVVSREREKVGYDLLATREQVELHLEVKGVSGNSPDQFPITANEVAIARIDSQWRIAIVVNALEDSREMIDLSGAEFLQQYDLKPIAYRAVKKPKSQ